MTLVGSNGHTAEAGHVEHKASIAGGVSGIAVASAAYSERQMVRACEAKGCLDVLWVGGMHDEHGMRSKLGRIDFPKLLVFRVARAKDLSSKSSRKGREAGIARLRDATATQLAEKSSVLAKNGSEEQTPRQRKERRFIDAALKNGSGLWCTRGMCEMYQSRR